ncbi:hypothetical protein B1813_05410 [Saccharomonospora piscinae]|uniref:D-apionate lactonase C-terminal domain-containing protein n=1 Tax=Saccharomonospora piscinae TaxID=687388 RepID=A0A1V9AA55_SACPI|nr:hypothetical protein [Saccharomonospora piscinae]OQO93950.1 hypothetical protein B1813_05410 [Saccharomonospora piscinae]
MTSPRSAQPVVVDWDTPAATSRTELTTHVWTAPPLRRGSPIHDKAFAALRDLKANHVRLLPWWSSPRLSVPELDPPADGRTSWDFGNLDPFVDDFLDSAQGRPVVANFATIPTWMFDTPEPVRLADDPAAIHWNYEQGTEFRDPTLTEVADHFERIGRWYLDGGFTDQFGVRHESGRRHRFDYWEVLCEPDIGHELSPEVYTRLYDEVVRRLRRLDPDMKFVGLSLSLVELNPEYFWHFLDPANHEEGVPLDAISYHFYGSPELLNPLGPDGNLPFDHWRSSYFSQADGFLRQVRLIDSIRRRLSPGTKTFINEIGTFNPDVMNPEPDVPEQYWALGGAVVAYLFSELTRLGVDLVGVAEFVGYPGMVPGVSMLDWNTGEPNARYQVVKLLLEHFDPGDTLHTTGIGGLWSPESRFHAQAFTTTHGQRRVLLVNKYAEHVDVELPGAATTAHVDAGTGGAPAVTDTVSGDTITLGPFATMVVTMR